MLNFKDILRSDLKVFFNPAEFSEPHEINGRTLNVVIDNDRLMQRSKKEFDGISIGEILYYVAAEEYGEPPGVDEVQIFDRKKMQVFDVRADAGVYEIILRRNE
ncbi:hypothetical protein DFR58_10186 [Anaerobacterium chartisolvens]|uniref:ATP-binding sugar transporter Gifsy-2 n=1 Tax=Anaerobacterium chartisolvens TaxID=1297424 RepID=A0A369BMH6_9FIRM|nr:hypothetical protein [Anaerobacterium chartisolvens]RCX20884.1 hypothetical protein DFR58_10186 [Anaerobacterium chartisolvens]